MRTQQMEKDVSFSFLLASFALLIPFPGRLAYGILLVILLNVQMFSIAFFRGLVELVHLNDLLSVLTAAMLMCESIIFKQLLAIYSPLMALTLSFVIYLPAVSSFIISRLNPLDAQLDCWGATKGNMGYSLAFSGIALAFFLARDIIGYGTITLPGRKELLCIHLFGQGEGAHVGVFLATIPGAILFAFTTSFVMWRIRRKSTMLGGFSDDSRA
ncbi:MAG: hypothetical protein K6G18_15635 [Treponema sp.]|nr:hypothetical protein [Treponema sp.]MCR5623272.1 hypothetical protein [Treponema sp.]